MLCASKKVLETLLFVNLESELDDGGKVGDFL
jgi:hypothetical protein